jgi:hypothetical protein
MCNSHANGHMSLLYVGCMKFPTNWFLENLCPFLKSLIFTFMKLVQHA